MRKIDNEFEQFQKELNEKALKFADAAKVVYSAKDYNTLTEAIDTNNDLYSIAAEMYRMLDNIFTCADDE